jgi:hypothetical protein
MKVIPCTVSIETIKRFPALTDREPASQHVAAGQEGESSAVLKNRALGFATKSLSS